MNCSQVNSDLVAYLHGEVSPDEKVSIQAHLETCSSCQAELRRFSILETGLAQHLQLQVEQVHPAATAWHNLQTRIGQEGWGNTRSEMRSIPRFHFKKQTTRALVLVMVVILVILLASPPVRTLAARVGEWVGSWFRFNTPGAESSMSVGGFEAFAPYTPTYLPNGFDSSGLGGTSAPDLERLELTYSDGELFVVILQSMGSGAGDLPQGKTVTVNGETGRFVEVFATSAEELQQKIPGISAVTEFDYGRTSLLAWYLAEIKLEMVSNLPAEELLKIAQSLVLAEGGAGNSSP